MGVLSAWVTRARNPDEADSLGSSRQGRLLPPKRFFMASSGRNCAEKKCPIVQATQKLSKCWRGSSRSRFLVGLFKTIHPKFKRITSAKARRITTLAKTRSPSLSCSHSFGVMFRTRNAALWNRSNLNVICTQATHTIRFPK
jgi:hypothetical protein